MLERVWDDTTVVGFRSNTLHRVSFTSSRLTVRKYCSVESVKNCVNQRCEGFCVKIILFGVAVVYRVESKSFDWICWTKFRVF